MPKQLLHEQLGVQYINEWFAGALFMHENKLHRLRGIERMESGTAVRTHSISLTAGSPRWAGDSVPLSALVDFSTFKYPKLGYRQFRQGRIGNIVVQMTSVRAAQRGLRIENMTVTSLPAYRAVEIPVSGEGYAAINDARVAKEIFNPTFTPFSVGLRQLLEGEALAFAVNGDLAVGAACVNDGSQGFNVYFRGRVVGTVDERGNLSITNKILQRESLKKKLFG